MSALRMENQDLTRRLTEIGQRYNEATVDNRNLRSDLEALRAKASTIVTIILFIAVIYRQL